MLVCGQSEAGKCDGAKHETALVRKEVPRKRHGTSGSRRACPKDTSFRYLWVGFAG